MIEPLKFLTLGFVILLLAPFVLVFWRGAKFVPLSDSRRIEDLQDMRESLKNVIPQGARFNAASSALPDNPAMQHRIVEALGIYPAAPLWLSFYPRRWVAVVGLLAVAAVFVCAAVLLFVPQVIEITP